MGNRLLGFLRRVLIDVRDGESPRSWSPSTLDPYGLVAIRDAREDDEVRTAVQAIIALPAESEAPERTQA